MKGQQSKEAQSAEAYVPAGAGLTELAEAAQDCKGCDLYKHATQAVFGEGPEGARVILVGEQPGDQEDLAGKPFVGPAGKLLDRALSEAGIDRSLVYVTNAVKHFKFQIMGKRRIHDKPNARQLAACRAWLAAEVDRIQPEILVCLGATAAKSVFGSSYRVTKQHGTFTKHPWAGHATSTFHPSVALRAPDEAARERSFQEIVSDLKEVRRRMG